MNFKDASRLGTTDDAAFARALKGSDVPVILTAEAQTDNLPLPPLEVIRNSAPFGFANLIVAPDGVVRTTRFLRESLQSFAALISREYAGRITGHDLKIAPSESVRIVYTGPAGTFPTISFADVLSDKADKELLQDAIVLVGATVIDLQDFHQTPLGMMSGVEIHANTVHMLLSRQFFSQSRILTVFSIIILASLAVWISRTVKRLSLLLLALAVIFVAYNLAAFISFDNFFIADLLYPNLALLFGAGLSITEQYVATAREKKFIQEIFSRYLAPQVIHELLHDPSKLKLGGERANLTILFSDIRNFTAISETMTPEQLTGFLNDYLGRMTLIVLERRGVIDKYIGDAVMAFWGAPLPSATHALDGVLSALAMIQELTRFNESHRALGEPVIDIGIGLNSGEVTVGNMGSEQRFDYTVMGDNVNIASRLEGLTKTYGANILISDTTAALLNESERRKHHIVLRELDTVRVKGKKHAVKIYQVVPQERQKIMERIKNEFDAGRAAYYRGRWDEAITMFEKVLMTYPDDAPTRTLIERCQGFKYHPADDWEGVFELTHK